MPIADCQLMWLANDILSKAAIRTAINNSQQRITNRQLAIDNR